MGVLALLGFIAFVSILLLRIDDIAIRIVIGLVVVMAAWDFWLSLRPAARKRREDRPEGS
jgi:uncharacterized membrane protein YfcA